MEIRPKELISLIMDFYIGTIILKENKQLVAEMYPVLDAGIRMERICCGIMGLQDVDFTEEFKNCGFDKDATVEKIYQRWQEAVAASEG